MEMTTQIQNPDELLWKIAINDDKEAYRILFDLFYPALCLFAKRYVEERAVAEDLVQDVFVTLWESRKKIVTFSISLDIPGRVQTKLYRCLSGKECRSVRL